VSDGAIAVPVPPCPRDENDTVVVLEIVGQMRVDSPILTHSSDTGFELDYMTAATAGNAAKRFNRDGRFHISKWTGPGDSVSWRLLVSQTGTYKVRIRYAARQAWAGAGYVVNIAGQSLPGTVKRTGDWYQYQTFDLGEVAIAKAGEYTASIRPATSMDHYLMYFQSLSLEPPLQMVE
jgi:hypothetical protein